MTYLIKLWVENVTSGNNTWGTIYNAAQFTPTPLQNRNRVIGGRVSASKVYHAYQRWYPEAMPCILACEGRGGLKKRKQAAHWEDNYLSKKLPSIKALIRYLKAGWMYLPVGRVRLPHGGITYLRLLETEFLCIWPKLLETVIARKTNETS